MEMGCDTEKCPGFKLPIPSFISPDIERRSGDLFSLSSYEISCFLVRSGAYVRLRGALSPKGQFPGIFIIYDRPLELTDVLEVRAIQEGDCP